jgi:methylmalonyl-CoA/ethylmalonyl-CoA epimerase
VDDIQSSFETLKSRWVTFTDDPHMIAKMPDHELWMALFKDVDDNVLAIMCEVRD